MTGPWEILETTDYVTLFVFDPQRRAVLLLGGDKSTDQKWNDWYPAAVRIAEQIYGEFVKNMESE